MIKLIIGRVSKLRAIKMAIKLSSKMIISNRIFSLALLQTSFALIGLVIRLIFLLLKEPPIDPMHWFHLFIGFLSYLVTTYFLYKRLKRRRAYYLMVMERRKYRQRFRKEARNVSQST